MAAHRVVDTVVATIIILIAMVYAYYLASVASSGVRSFIYSAPLRDSLEAAAPAFTIHKLDDITTLKEAYRNFTEAFYGIIGYHIGNSSLYYAKRSSLSPFRYQSIVARADVRIFTSGKDLAEGKAGIRPSIDNTSLRPPRGVAEVVHVRKVDIAAYTSGDGKRVFALIIEDLYVGGR